MYNLGHQNRSDDDAKLFANGGIRTGLTPSPHSHHPRNTTNPQPQYQVQGPPSSMSFPMAGAVLTTDLTSLAENTALHTGFDLSFRPDDLVEPCGHHGHNAICWNSQRNALWDEYITASARRIQHVAEMGMTIRQAPIGVDESYLTLNILFHCQCGGRAVSYQVRVELVDEIFSEAWWDIVTFY